MQDTKACKYFKMDLIGSNPNICTNCKFEKKQHEQYSEKLQKNLFIDQHGILKALINTEEDSNLEKQKTIKQNANPSQKKVYIESHDLPHSHQSPIQQQHLSQTNIQIGQNILQKNIEIKQSSQEQKSHTTLQAEKQIKLKEPNEQQAGLFQQIITNYQSGQQKNQEQLQIVDKKNINKKQKVNLKEEENKKLKNEVINLKEKVEQEIVAQQQYSQLIKQLEEKHQKALENMKIFQKQIVEKKAIFSKNKQEIKLLKKELRQEDNQQQEAKQIILQNPYVQSAIPKQDQQENVNSKQQRFEQMKVTDKIEKQSNQHQIKMQTGTCKAPVISNKFKEIQDKIQQNALSFTTQLCMPQPQCNKKESIQLINQDSIGQEDDNFESSKVIFSRTIQVQKKKSRAKPVNSAFDDSD